MPYERASYDNFSAALDAALSRVRQLPADSNVPVIVVPSRSVANQVRVVCAERGCAFGVRVETFASWLQDRWELYGDGRVMVEPHLRKLLVAQVLRDGGEGAAAAGALVAAAARDVADGDDAAAGVRAGACAAAPCSPGLVDLLAEVAEEALPQVLERAAARDRALTAAQRRVVAALARYADLLAERSRCELSQVASELARQVELPPLLVVGAERLPASLEALLECGAARGLVARFDDARLRAAAGPRSTELAAVLARLFTAGDAVEATGDVRVALPAGRYAQPVAVLREVERLLVDDGAAVGSDAATAPAGADAAGTAGAAATVVEAADAAIAAGTAHDAAATGAATTAEPSLPIAVSSKNPLRLYDRIAGALARQGRIVAVHGSRALRDTSLGRALAALLAVAFPDGQAAAADCGAAAADFALSAFSGIPRAVATSLDAAWRADRLLSRDRLLEDLSRAGGACAEMLRSCANRDFPALIDAFERSALACGPTGAWRAEQLAAASQARRILDAATDAGEPFPDAVRLLAGARIAVRAQSAEGAPEVVIMPFDELARLQPCSCASAVICDMTSADYPVRAVDTAKTLLFEALGIALNRDELSRMRRQLVGALSAARSSVVLCRVMNTVDAAESYPAVMFDEIVDCYRGARDAEGRVDRATGLPQRLAAFSRMQGEDELTACMAVGLSRADAKRLPPSAPADRATARARRFVALPRAIDDDAPSRAVLSASAVESYLECPHKWFALRRLKLNAPDAGFGPLEMGSFAHAVLRSFYVGFQEEGFVKVDAGNMPRAIELLDASFDAHLVRQPALRPSHNPLVPTNSYERDDVERLRANLHDYLGREPQLLPGFSPRFFELPFGDEAPFEYAGFLLRGSIDRIDVNDRGQAVIIDYKGSVGPDYALSANSPLAFGDPGEAGEGASLPHKIQALVYAQVAKRLLGLEPVGALYVSYGAKPIVLGAVDRTVLGPVDLPGKRFDECAVPGEAACGLGVGSFGELLCAVEDRIRVAAGKLRAGFIEPNPRGARACAHCPVLSCAKRSGHES